MSNTNERANVVVQRRTGVVGAVYSAIIYADEIKIGELSAGETRAFSLDTGITRLHAKLPQLISNPLELNLLPSDVVELALVFKGGLVLEITKESASSINATSTTTQLTSNDSINIEKRLATLDRARREAESSLQRDQARTRMNSVTIAGIILFVIGLALLLFDRTGTTCAIVAGLGIIVSIVGLAQKAGASRAYDEENARLKKIEEEIFDLQKKQASSSTPSVKALSPASVIQHSDAMSVDSAKTSQLEVELKNAKQMLDNGIIDQEEYQALRKKLLQAL